MTWALQDAKNKFSSVANTAWNGEPQVVTRHGKPLVVVISYNLYRSKIQPKRKKNIVEAFMNCPIDADIAPLIAPRSRGSGRATPVNFAEEA
jgi:prevent-host-death family protein